MKKNSGAGSQVAGSKETGKAKRKASAGVLAVAALGSTVVGAGMASASPASALGLDTVFTVGSTAYDMYDHCMANQAVGEDCLKSEHATISETWKTVKEIQTSMAKNQKESLEKMDYIIKEQADQNVKDAAGKLLVDYRTAWQGSNLYSPWVGCMDAISSGTATCQVVNQSGENPKEAPANLDTLKGTYDRLLANETTDQAKGIAGWNYLPSVVSRMVGGVSTNPYKADGLLQAVFKKKLLDLQVYETVSATMPTTYFPASFVNECAGSPKPL